MENGGGTDAEHQPQTPPVVDKTFISRILGEMKQHFNNNGDVEEVAKIEAESPKDSDRSNDSDGGGFRKPDERRPRRPKEEVVAAVEPKRSTRRRSRDYSESVLQTAIARKEKSYNETSKPQRLTRQLKPTQKILENIANAAALKQDKRKATKATEEEGRTKRAKRTTKGEQQRRNDRVSSPKNEDEETTKQDDSEEVSDQASGGENTAPSPPTPARLCVCQYRTQIYAFKDTDDDPMCMAVDALGDRLVGCGNVVDDVADAPMLRPSQRVPYALLCRVHRGRLVRHNCCPTCGVFCTQGVFAQCENRHQYHRACRSADGGCPHCGGPTPERDVRIDVELAVPPVFLSTRRAVEPSEDCTNEVEAVAVNEEDPASPPIVVGLRLNDDDRSSPVEEPPDPNVFRLLELLTRGDDAELADLLGSLAGAVDLDAEIVGEDDDEDDVVPGTLLHRAARLGRTSAVHLLTTAGASLDAPDSERNTPLMVAVAGFRNDVVRYLVRAGSDVTAKGMDGMTALHLAAKSGNVDACRLLLTSSTHVRGYKDMTDDGGWTPLVWACEHAHLPVVRLLLSEGSDPHPTDVEGNSALHWASFGGNTSVVETVLNYEGRIDVVNSHGDTPLHIAARQDNLNCALVLLARGARIDAVNSVGCTPVDCCPEDGECRRALVLNSRLRKLVGVARRTPNVLANDISNGREPNAVPCINDVDEEPVPNDFIYVTKNCRTSDLSIDVRITALKSCSCEDRCSADSCDCGRLSTRCWYNEGRLVPDFNYDDPPMIFECNDLCSCSSRACVNRVVQRGNTSHRFEVFRTDGKGWGVRAARAISAGSYVAEYVGETITDVDADSRDDDTYLFDLDNREVNTYCIDAKYYGNFSRFINHSCRPNLVPVRVFVDHQDLKFPRIALFASRDIRAHEELGFDYGSKFWMIKYKFFTCECRAEDCRYSKETIDATVVEQDCDATL